MHTLMQCSLNVSNRSLAERRKFSSLEKLILNRLLFIEERATTKYQELLNFKVRGIKEVLEKEQNLIKNDIANVRKNVKCKYVKFEKILRDLKRFDILVENDEYVKASFAKLSFKVEKFYKEHLDLLMFDTQLFESSRFLNQKILKNMRRFATKYHFSKENIPAYVFVKI